MMHDSDPPPTAGDRLPPSLPRRTPLGRTEIGRRPGRAAWHRSRQLKAEFRWRTTACEKIKLSIIMPLAIIDFRETLCQHNGPGTEFERSFMARNTGDDDSAPTQDRVIARLLIDDIVAWRIPPGAWIREREIAARFGVSHAPVREAFRQVANIGLLKVVPWRGAFVIDLDQHAADEVYELWKALFGVACRLACAEMSDRDGRELMHRLVEYKDVTLRTENTFEHLNVSNRIGRFIAKRSNAPLALELLDRVALLARWQHNVYTNSYIETHGNEAARRSAALYETLCRHIVARDGDAADAAARALIGVTQESFEQALEEYKARHAKPRASRRRAKSA